jgi:LemA protein
MMPLLLLILVGVAGLILVAIGIYNGLVGLRNRAEASWADIEVQLKRRHDLIGNLVETVKGYATHERETLEKVIAARNLAAGSAEGSGPKAAGQAENMLTSTLRSLFAVAEAYPDLKANQNFQDLQKSLESLETEIQKARRYYNAVVRDFNTKIQSVPDVFVARMMSFTERDYFELSDPAEAQPPKVQF